MNHTPQKHPHRNRTDWKKLVDQMRWGDAVAGLTYTQCEAMRQAINRQHNAHAASCMDIDGTHTIRKLERLPSQRYTCRVCGQRGRHSLQMRGSDPICPVCRKQKSGHPNPNE